MKVNKGSRAG